MTILEVPVRIRVDYASHSHSSADPSRGNPVTRAERKPHCALKPLPQQTLRRPRQQDEHGVCFLCISIQEPGLRGEK